MGISPAAFNFLWVAILHASFSQPARLRLWRCCERCSRSCIFHSSEIQRAPFVGFLADRANPVPATSLPGLAKSQFVELLLVVVVVVVVVI